MGIRTARKEGDTMDRKELIKTAVLSVKKQDIGRKDVYSYPATVREASQCTAKQIRNAIAAYAPGCRPEDIAVLVDLTILNSGKKGYLFAKDGFYADRGQLTEEAFKKQGIPMPVIYEELKRVELEGNDYLIFSYKDGRSFMVFSSIYGFYLKAVFGKIIDALNGDEENNGKEEKPKEAAESDAVSRAEEESASGEADTPEEEAPLPTEMEGLIKDYADRTVDKALAEARAEVETETAREEAAAEAGDPESAYSCGKMYEDGTGVEKDEKKAFIWYEKAAKQGHAEAQFHCGMMCDMGWGTEKNPKKAFTWYRKAALQGHARAQYFCGEMYEEGRGVAADSEKSQEWYRKASLQGEESADWKYDWMRIYTDPKEQKTLASWRVMVCSGVLLTRGTIVSTLKEGGIGTIYEAGNEAEALEKCGKMKPQVVLIDSLLPGTNGFETAEKIMQKWPGTKIAIVQQFALREATYELKQKYGAALAGVIDKPLKKEKILGTVAKAFALRRQRKASGTV